VPSGLKRYQQSGKSHFVTFCCFHRLLLFTNAEANSTFEAALERVRRNYGL
jgi:putative transposase